MPDSDDRHKYCSNCAHLHGAIIILALFLVLAIILLLSIINVDPLFVAQLKQEDYKDSIKTALALGRLDAIVIMLTLFTIVIGALAIYGYKEIKEKAIRVARKTSKEEAKRAIKEEARIIASREARSVYRNLIRSLMPNEDIDELIRNIDKETKNLSLAEISQDQFKTLGDIEPLYMDKDDGNE